MSDNSQMENKTVLITGASDGIGKVTARALAEMGARVVMAGRNREKTEAAAGEIRAQTGNNNVSVLIGDLSLMAEVRHLAEEFISRYDRLDVLVNNAGGLFMKRQVTAEGLELTLALNHLSYFLLTGLLMEVLRTSAPARVVNVSSGAHLSGRIRFDDLELKKAYGGWKAYSASKLMNILFTYELARQLKGSDVTVNALAPGYVATCFGLNNDGFYGKLFKLSQAFAQTPEKGAETSIFLASSPLVEGVTGKYYSHSRETRSSRLSYDRDLAGRLWQRSLEMTGPAGSF